MSSLLEIIIIMFTHLAEPRDVSCTVLTDEFIPSKNLFHVCIVERQSSHV